MSNQPTSAIHRQPSYVVNAQGQPEAVIIDFNTWQMILERLEDIVDNEVIRQVVADLDTLSKGVRPSGWQSWEEFETEINSLETAGELPD